MLCVRRLGPLDSCSPVRVLVVFCRLCRFLGFLAPVLRRARSVCGVVCVVSWAFWSLCAGVLVWFVLCCVCGVPGHLVRVLRCCGVLRCVWCSVCGVACAVSWASRPLFTGVYARCVVLCGRCPGPLGSCSPVCLCGVLCGVCGVLGLVAPVHRCARSLCGVLCLVTWASWLPFTGVPVLCVAWFVRCPGPLGSRSPVWPRGVCCVACSVSWAPWLLLTGVLYACSVCCVFCAVSWAMWLRFTGVLARCVAWCVRCGCGCVLGCAILSSLHFSSRPRVNAVDVLLLRSCVHSCHMPFGPCVADSLFLSTHRTDIVGNTAANSPLAFRPTRRPASYGVLLILPVLDSLILATPKSERVLMHTWRCMLFTRWSLDSLHFATPKSRRVCLMHS